VWSAESSCLRQQQDGVIPRIDQACPVPDFFHVCGFPAYDNVTASQLQGHTGTLSECGTCHVTSELPSNTQCGPHGMHLVNDSRFWREAHKDAAKQQNGRPGGGTCGACHGSDHLGTVLSRAPVDRSLSVEGTNRRVAAGEAIGCGLCHSVSKSFGR
jgi:hypothetical protein